MMVLSPRHSVSYYTALLYTFKMVLSPRHSVSYYTALLYTFKMETEGVNGTNTFFMVQFA